jgi:hypothetical protein
MCTPFCGTIDQWDPALLHLLAAEREVIAFDNVGTASSTIERDPAGHCRFGVWRLSSARC